MDRHLSDSWTGFTKFTLLNEKPFKEYMWSGGRPTKIRATARPHHLWPEIWTCMSKADRKKQKREWAIEKPKLDNARMLRGFYFIDPEDGGTRKPKKKQGKVRETD